MKRTLLSPIVTCWQLEAVQATQPSSKSLSMEAECAKAMGATTIMIIDHSMQQSRLRYSILRESRGGDSHQAALGHRRLIPALQR
jgi:hypothetical protein